MKRLAILAVTLALTGCFEEPDRGMFDYFKVTCAGQDEYRHVDATMDYGGNVRVWQRGVLIAVVPAAARCSIKREDQ